METTTNPAAQVAQNTPQAIANAQAYIRTLLPFSLPEQRQAALDQLLSGTSYATYHRATTLTVAGTLFEKRNLVTLSRFPLFVHGNRR